MMSQVIDRFDRDTPTLSNKFFWIARFFSEILAKIVGTPEAPSTPTWNPESAPTNDQQ